MKVKKEKVADLWLYLELFRPFTDEAVKTVASWLDAEPMSNETFVETLKHGTEFLEKKGIDLDGYVVIDNKEAVKTHVMAKNGVRRALLAYYDLYQHSVVPFNILTMQSSIAKWGGFWGAGDLATKHFLEGKISFKELKKMRQKPVEYILKNLKKDLKVFGIDKKPDFPLHLNNKDIVKLIKRSDVLYKIYRNRVTL